MADYILGPIRSAAAVLVGSLWPVCFRASQCLGDAPIRYARLSANGAINCGGLSSRPGNHAFMGLPPFSKIISADH
jgi:hypothetical protein